MNKIKLALIFFVIVLQISFVFGATCEGVPDCDYSRPNLCNADCACAWSGQSCVVRDCGNCGTSSQCEASGCFWEEDDVIYPPVINETIIEKTVIIDNTVENTIEEVVLVPIKLNYENLFSGMTVRRGVLEIVVSGYEGKSLSDKIKVFAESEIFGVVELFHSVDRDDFGMYRNDVLITNVTEDGIYEITVSGSLDTYDEESISLALDSNIYSDIEILDFYEKGNSLVVSGNLTYHDASPAKDVGVKIVIKNSADTFEIFSRTNYNGIFELDYPISFAEADGTWYLTFEYEDEYGNYGEEAYTTEVTTPSGVLYYGVTFLSPVKYGEYKRGDTVPISVKITDEGVDLLGANVSYKDIDGISVMLSEKEGGTYSGSYVVPQDASVGDWNIKVEAIKEAFGAYKAGGNSLAVNVLPANLVLSIDEPRRRVYYAGQRMYIKAKLAYVDGAVVSNAIMYAYLDNMSVMLNEVEPGLYEGSFLFKQNDEKLWDFKVRANDIYDNEIQTKISRVEVRRISEIELKLILFYYDFVLRYLLYEIIAFVILLMIFIVSWRITHRSKRLKAVEVLIEKNIELQKNLQRQYFKYHKISRDDYKNMMEKYKSLEADLNQRKINLQDKIKRKDGKRAKKSS